MFRRVLMLAVTTVAVLSGAMLASGGATAAQAATCTGGVAVSQFAFNPSSVPPGGSSPLTLVLQNCTSQTIQGSNTLYGRYTWAGSGIAPGCPAIDPVGYPYTIAPGATYTLSQPWGDTFPTCQATGLTMTVNVNVNGATGTAATANASLVIRQPASTCHVTYSPSTWQGGFTASVTIGNAGSAPINGWTLTFSFPGDQKITNAWNAAVSQTGQNVSAANLSYNATIPAGGSQSFGFQGTWTSSQASPISFSVNGVACS